MEKKVKVCNLIDIDNLGHNLSFMGLKSWTSIFWYKINCKRNLIHRGLKLEYKKVKYFQLGIPVFFNSKEIKVVIKMLNKKNKYCNLIKVKLIQRKWIMFILFNKCKIYLIIFLVKSKWFNENSIGIKILDVNN